MTHFRLAAASADLLRGGVEATRRYKRKDPAQEREVLKAQTGPNELIWLENKEGA